MDARTDYKKFWDCFHEVWLENGGESLFTYAQKDFWAVLDSNEPTRVTPHISVDFGYRGQYIRLNVHCYKQYDLCRMIQAHRQEHEENIGERLEFFMSSRGNARVKIEYPISIGNTEEYVAAIEKILPVLLKFRNEFKGLVEAWNRYMETYDV